MHKGHRTVASALLCNQLFNGGVGSPVLVMVVVVVQVGEECTITGYRDKKRCTISNSETLKLTSSQLRVCNLQGEVLNEFGMHIHLMSAEENS